MVWSWSHTAEGVCNAYAQCHALDRATLETIYAEIEAADPISRDFPGMGSNLNGFKYAHALYKARTLPHDVLADLVWDFAEEQAACNNGGFEAYLCPFLCGCHTVPFDPVTDSHAA